MKGRFDRQRIKQSASDVIENFLSVRQASSRVGGNPVQRRCSFIHGGQAPRLGGRNVGQNTESSETGLELCAWSFLTSLILALLYNL